MRGRRRSRVRRVVALAAVSLVACRGGEPGSSSHRTSSPVPTSRSATDASRYVPGKVAGRPVEHNVQSKGLEEAIKRGEGIDDAAVATVGAKPNPDDLPDMLLEAIAGGKARKGADATRDNLAGQLLGSVTDAGDKAAGGLAAHVWFIRSTQRTPPQVVFALAEDAGVVLVAVDFQGDEAAALSALEAMANAGRG